MPGVAEPAAPDTVPAMLAVKTYTQAYVDECRARVDAQLAAYAGIATSADSAALDAFEPEMFTNLVLVLEACFAHRVRGAEGKDGNPLNEVRMLAVSLLSNKGVLLADASVRYKPEASVLGLAIGASIRLDESDFRRLAESFFAEIEAKFT